MRLDPLLALMEDGTDREVALELLERLLELDELHVQAPQGGGVLGDHVGSQQIARLPQLGGHEDANQLIFLN